MPLRENPLHTLVRGVPPGLGEAQRATLKEAVQGLPEAAGIGLANWNWKGVH